jgi:SAM-dependent methyltransferase
MAALNRLAFVIPDFTRIAWTSDRARAAWEPRLKRISHAWAQIEWLSVARGVRRCCVSRMPDARFQASTAQWAAHSVSALGLGREAAGWCTYSSSATTPVSGRPSVLCVGLARYADLAPLQEAWDGHDDERLGELLGYPDCCRGFFRRVWVEGAHVDTTWHMAVNSDGATRSNSRIDVAGPGLANILCRWIGVRAVPHLPCSFNCDATVRLAESLLDVGVTAGFAEEMAWVREILSWPVEWSALHGIAEIRTPILKVSARTDATSMKYEVRRSGLAYPDEGASGLRFPYRTSAAPVLASRPITLRPSAPSWQYIDNGFASQSGMDRAHAPLVALAAGTLGSGGAVLDLGCGNAILLKKIYERVGKRAIPFGIDLRHEHVAHARNVLPDFASNFRVGDMLAGEDLSALRRHYRLVILGINRLLEVSQERARQFTQEIRRWCDYLLVYRYPSAEPLLDLDALADGFDLRVTVRTADAVVAEGFQADEFLGIRPPRISRP